MSLNSNSNSNNENSTSQDNFSSSFIFVMMIVYAITSLYRGGSDPVMFKVGGAKYTLTMCKKYLACINDPYVLSHDDKFQKHYYEVLEIAQKRAVITELCKGLGLKVSDEDMKKSILNDPLFFQDGVFSRDVFLSYLAALRVSETEFYALRREDLLHKQFWYFVKNAYHLPESAIEFFNNAYYAKRRFKLAVAPHSAIKISYTEKDLRRFYEKNLDLFKTPKNYTYVAWRLNKELVHHEADRVLLNRYIENRNFKAVGDNYKGEFLDHQALSDIFGDQLQYFSYGRSFELNDCICFAWEDSLYFVMVSQVEESKTLSFEEVKESVISLYEEKTKALKVNKKTLVWKQCECDGSDYSNVALPFDLAEVVFDMNIGEEVSFTRDGVTYFLKMESFELLPSVTKDDSLIREFIGNSLEFAFVKYLVSVNLSR